MKKTVNAMLLGMGLVLGLPTAHAKTIEQIAQFDGVTPERLYQVYLSADEHAAFTGFPAVIDPREGGEINTFQNVPGPGEFGVTGRILKLDAAAHAANQYVIVQSWRGFHDKPTDVDSTLILTFTTSKEGAQIKLVQVNVPDELAELVSKSWQERYWAPLKKYLAENPSSQKSEE